MTREEAVQILSTRDAHGVLCGYTSGVTEALDMAISALQGGDAKMNEIKNPYYMQQTPSEDGNDLIIKGAKGIQDGLYNIKDGKLFMYKANGGTVRTYPIVPSADRPIADKCDDCLYEDSDKSLFPCTYCKRNHFDKYEKDESNNITESANDANETENDVIDSDTTSKERLIHSVFESAKQFTSAEPTEDYSDLPDIPRAYYEKIVGNMSHEINMLKEQLESADAVSGYTEWLEKIIVDAETIEWLCEDTPCKEWCDENCHYSSIQVECLRHLYEVSKGGDAE